MFAWELCKPIYFPQKSKFTGTRYTNHFMLWSLYIHCMWCHFQSRLSPGPLNCRQLQSMSATGHKTEYGQDSFTTGNTLRRKSVISVWKWFWQICLDILGKEYWKARSRPLFLPSPRRFYFQFCLFVCQRDYTKTNKLCGGMGHGTRTNHLTFGTIPCVIQGIMHECLALGFWWKYALDCCLVTSQRIAFWMLITD